MRLLNNINLHGGYSVRILKALIVLCITGIFLVSCDSGSDSGGTTGGGGETSTQTTTENKSTSAASEPESTNTVTSASKIFLSATSDFACSSNWSYRDGAMALDAYTGNGTCKASFPGETGTYKIVLNAQLERDGQPSYIISVDGVDVNGGRYPLSAPRGCNCSYQDCPDKNYDIGAGTHTISNGSTIGFYGTEDFPCGSGHGAYAKWHGMTFTRVN